MVRPQNSFHTPVSDRENPRMGIRLIPACCGPGAFSGNRDPVTTTGRTGSFLRTRVGFGGRVRMEDLGDMGLAILGNKSMPGLSQQYRDRMNALLLAKSHCDRNLRRPDGAMVPPLVTWLKTFRVASSVSCPVSPRGTSLSRMRSERVAGMIVICVPSARFWIECRICHRMLRLSESFEGACSRGLQRRGQGHGDEPR